MSSRVGHINACGGHSQLRCVLNDFCVDWHFMRGVRVGNHRRCLKSVILNLTVDVLIQGRSGDIQEQVMWFNFEQYTTKLSDHHPPTSQVQELK